MVELLIGVKPCSPRFISKENVIGVFCLLLFLLVSQNVFLQNNEFIVHDYGFRLSKDLIKGIITDKHGYVWSATDQGVIRFDGQESIFFRGVIPGGFAKALCRTSDERLLVLHDLGLSEIFSKPDTTIFNLLILGSPEDTDSVLHYPKTIYEDKKGRIWIGENQSIVLYKNGSVKKFRLEKNRDYGVITRSFSFIEDANGKVWIFSYSGYLLFFDESLEQFIEQPLNRALENVASITNIDNQKVWLGTKEGLFELELKLDSQPLPVQKIRGPPNISCSLLLDGGIFFIGSWDNGLFYSTTTADPPIFEKVENLPFNDIIGLFYDERHGLWATGQENSALLVPVLFDVVDLGTEKKPSITALKLSANGNILLIGDENEINTQKIYELNGTKIISEYGYPETSFGNVPLAVCDIEGNILYGDLGGSVFYLNKKSKENQKITEIKNSNSSISMIQKDNLENIWIAGNINHGLIKLQPDNSFKFYKEKGLGNSKIIFLSKKGELYIGGRSTDNFLFKYNEEKDEFKNISIPCGECDRENFEVKDMVMDGKGNLFLASNNGVFSYNVGKTRNNYLKQIDLKKVPLNEPSNALAFGPDGTLWVSTTSGLVAYQGKSSFLFDKASGLPANSLTDRGLLFDNEGNLWIGTAKGLVLFRKEKIRFSDTPSPIIEAVKINFKKRIKKTFADTLIPHNAGLEIDFLSLSYPASEVVYKTRLLNFDSTWSDAAYAKQWYVTGLRPGAYKFQVKAQQQKGHQWSSPTEYIFTIAKPWYLKLFPASILIAVAAAFLVLVARLYNIRLIRQKKKLESIIKKRTNEINRQKNEIIEQQKKIIDQSETMRSMEEDKYKSELNYKNKQLTTYTLNLIQKNQSLKELRLKINQIIRGSSKNSYRDMRKLINMIDSSFRKDEDWENFKLYFEQVHVGFFEKLINRHPKLTSHDLRYCALVRLNLSIEEMSTIIGISSDSIKTAKFRLKKKMELDSGTDLMEYLLSVK